MTELEPCPKFHTSFSCINTVHLNAVGAPFSTMVVSSHITCCRLGSGFFSSVTILNVKDIEDNNLSNQNVIA